MPEMAYFDEWFTPQESMDYAAMMNFAKRGNKGAFGRFGGRSKEIFTFNEFVIAQYLASRGIRFIHNWTFQADGFRVEFDFFLEDQVAVIHVDPLLHYKLGHKVTRDVHERDVRNDEWARAHGIKVIRLVAYDNQKKFFDEIERKLGNLRR